MFEQLIAEVLQSSGWEVERTAQMADGGADLLAVSRDAAGIATRYVVECKRWAADRAVPVDLVRALYGVKSGARPRADNPVFVTTSRFTRSVWKLQRDGEFRNLSLVDFDGLREWLRQYHCTVTGGSTGRTRCLVESGVELGFSAAVGRARRRVGSGGRRVKGVRGRPAAAA